ncbi:MAG TPA: hypothetical protein VFF29_06105 [Bacteroidota bacterium]|nr:hypothetical protein [Bacteroidota bacterium]
MSNFQQLIEINDKIREGEFVRNKELLASVLSQYLIFQRANQTIVDKETYLRELDNITYEAVENNSIEIKFDVCETKAISVVYVKAKGNNTRTKKEFDGVYKNVRFFRKEKNFILFWKEPQWKLYAWYNEVIENKNGDKINVENKVALRDEDYIILWQFFEDRAQKIKERLWTVFSFHAAILISLVGFNTKEAFNKSHDWTLLIIANISGLLYSLFVILQMNDMKYHIKRNHDRANNVEAKISDLKNLIDKEGAAGNNNRFFSSNKFTRLILAFLYILVFIFIVLLIVSITKQTC